MKQQQDPLLRMVGMIADHVTDNQAIALTVVLIWTAILLS